MTNKDAIYILSGLKRSLNEYCGLNNNGQKAFDIAISALQAQDSSVDLFPDLTIVEKAEIRGYVKGQLDAINDLVAAGLIEREKAISILKDHDLDEAGKDTISRQAAIAEFSCCDLTPDGGIDVNYAIDFLEQLPPAHTERKVGHWLIREGISDAQCSECKMYFNNAYDMDNSDAFCRHCGTKMEGLKVVKDE